jgi:hypothetical protein
MRGSTALFLVGEFRLNEKIFLSTELRPFSDGIPPGVPLHTSSEAGLPVLKCFRAPVADPQSAN